ncbi:MAG TPA: ferrochelatase [Woeseiaceae bacterium]|nr:ferrochelatase [Woeseiaceae bacterium]
MPSYETTPQFEHGQATSTGVLVVNLGTPAAPTAGAVRRFLREFLSDPRVVEYPRALWWLILNLVILVIRPSRSAAAYRKIWTDRGSPLMLYSQSIADKLREKFSASVNTTVLVELAMTYGQPSINDAIDRLLAGGARRLFVLPLYPQYSGTTTAAVFDAVMKKLGKLRWIPETRWINSYHDDPAFIDALANSVQRHWQDNPRGETLLMSFHGIPKSLLEKGDPYFCQCQKTARLLAGKLGLGDNEWMISFQSRVGREEWLAPYTDESIRSLARSGTREIDVICPGFATDCLETLEEIAMQNAEFFREGGGATLRYIPSLNDSDSHIEVLAGLALQHVTGWEAAGGGVPDKSGRERAIAMGAAR